MPRLGVPATNGNHRNFSNNDEHKRETAMFQNLIDIITAPSAAFARLKEKPAILFPMLLVLLALCSVQVGYILLTDRGFLIDQQMEQIEAILPNLTDAQREQMTENSRNQSTTALILSATIGILVVYSLIVALYALYLRFVSKFSFVDIGWKAWFSLSWWTSIPLVFGALASWAVLLSNSNGQVPLVDLNPLNFANLLGLDTQNSLLMQVGPLYLWSFALLALGFQNWTKKSLVASALISLAPYLLIFGIWGYFSM
jgi:hypothetical protein